jgi:16S rRNA (cytosine967-C5)-methyltransferase
VIKVKESKKTTVRDIAYRVLQQVFSQQGYTNLVLQQALKGNSKGTPLATPMENRDKALCTEIVYGTVQRQLTIDAMLRSYISRPLADLDAGILTILRMTVYQLSFLDKIPPYAAIHEAVELAKRESPRAAGFVNGVLRSYMRTEGDLASRLVAAQTKANARTFPERMEILYSVPKWLVATLADTYGNERTEQILKSGNSASPLSLRVNQMRTSRDELLTQLSTSFEAIPSKLTNYGVRLSRGVDVEQLAAYQDGSVTVQDEGAMLIAPLLQAKPGERILDMCAAPGTKTTHIAEIQGDAGEVLACDIHVHKMKLIRQTRDRLGLTSIETRLSDARMLLETKEWVGAFDAILLDAPCSGIGVMRHRPDIRYRRKPKDILELARLQKELLQVAGQLVKPGGRIVYSTCTLLPAENQMVVQDVVRESQGELFIDDIHQDLPELVLPYLTKDGLVLTPELFDTDGFYMTRLRRRLES